MPEAVTDSARILSGASNVELVTDARGRQIEVRELSRREAMQLMRRWGTACNVEQWLNVALLGAIARSIDGKPLPVTQSADQIESILDLLGEEGTDAIGKWYMDRRAPDVGEVRSDAKN